MKDTRPRMCECGHPRIDHFMVPCPECSHKRSGNCSECDCQRYTEARRFYPTPAFDTLKNWLATLGPRTFTAADIQQRFGGNYNSASSKILRLGLAGLIERVDRGRYRRKEQKENSC